MPGPAPKPKDQRQNRIKRPEIGLVPAKEPSAIVPKPPAGLLATTRKIWRAYWESQVSNTADQNADMHRLRRWIEAVDEYEKVAKVFRKTRLVKGSMGQPVLNPLAAYLSTVEANISRAENEMGLTPLARLRLGITYGQAMLTAEALNRALDTATAEEPAAEKEPEAWEGEWEAV